jgi:uncharacterized membrane protein
MKRNYFWAGGLLVVLTEAVTMVLYSQLPERIPTHWNIHNQVDRYGDRWTALVIIPAIMLFIMAMMAALPWLSPRNFEVNGGEGDGGEANGGRTNGSQRSGRRPVYLQIMVVILAFMAYVHFQMLAAALGKHVNFGQGIVGAICALFAVIGVLIARVRRNFFVGVRTPWTLANERVWEATHRFAAKTFLAGGLAGLILAFLTRSPLPAVAVLAVGGMAPVIYSLVYYKQLQRRGEV